MMLLVRREASLLFQLCSHEIINTPPSPPISLINIITGLGMCISIVSKRQKMSHKDALLEQAAISAAGLQQSHILGSFGLLILIITVFALLGLKKITWALLLMLNIVLFAYLMKLTVDGSVKETVIGPDGKIVPDVDSDEEDEYEDDDEDDVGDYQNPTLPPRQTELPEIA